MHPQSQPYLGIMTPFGELKVIAQLGKGLLRQREVLHEILSKVLRDEQRGDIIATV